MPTARHHQGQADTVTMVVAVVSCLALVLSALAAGYAARAINDSGGGDTTTEASQSAEVTLSEFKIEPAAVRIGLGGTIEVHNVGTAAHNLAVKGTDLITPMVEAGGIASLGTTGLAAGSYTLYCEVPGHEGAGMTASLEIVGSDATAVASGGAGSGGAMSAEEMDTLMAKPVHAFPAETEGTGAQILEPKVLPDGVREFELTTSIVQWEVEPGRFVDGWAYNGTVPGPTLTVDPGDKVRVVLHNELPESTSIHFHGLVTPNAADGVPDITQDPVKPGQTYVYEFVAQDTPAVGMYHSHHDALVQVPNGLAGAFLVGNEPTPNGVSVAQEQVMMLNDAGTIGLTLNGKSFPATAPIVAKLGDWVRVHYMNEGLTVHPMHLHGMGQLVIAKDGYPVPEPYQADTVLVAPGERYTVLIHADNPGTWAWHCHILSHAERADGMFGMVTAMVVNTA